MKPPFSYFGGKTGMAPWIASLFPTHRIYLEPFAGSLAVLFAKKPAVHEVVNDIDHALVTFFRILRERPEDLARVCRLTPYARAEFDAATFDDAPDELELARRFWARVCQSFAKTAGPTTGWSTTVARTQATSVGVQNRILRFRACAERLARVSIECRPAIDVIRTHGRPEAVIYVDPPYLGTLRSHQSSSSVEYRHDMADDQSHIDLAAVLHDTPATVVLSCYPGELYEKLYGDWWHVDRAVTAHSSNARQSSRTGRIERIYANRDLNHGQLWEHV